MNRLLSTPGRTSVAVIGVLIGVGRPDTVPGRVTGVVTEVPKTGRSSSRPLPTCVIGIGDCLGAVPRIVPGREAIRALKVIQWDRRPFVD